MDLKKEYFRNGLVIVKDFFSKEEIDRVRNEAKAIFGIQIKKNHIPFNASNDVEFEQALYTLFKTNYEAFLGAAKAAQQMIELFDLTCSKQIKDLLSSIGIAQPVLCVKPIIYFNSPSLAKIEGHYKTPTHQDWRSMQGSLNSVVIWIPLVDMKPEIGPVEFVPGSHLHGLCESETDTWFRHIESKYYSDKDFIVPQVNKGDLVLFSAFTVHRSGNNISQHIRWSVHVRYNDLQEPTYIDRNFVHPYKVYQPESELITPGFPTIEDLKKTFPA